MKKALAQGCLLSCVLLLLSAVTFVAGCTKQEGFLPLEQLPGGGEANIPGGGTHPGGGTVPGGDNNPTQGGVPGTGTTVVGQTVTDSWQQPAQSNAGSTDRPADIFFVMDASGSLASERQLIANNIDKLLQELRDLKDYRVAIMTAIARKNISGEPVAYEKKDTQGRVVEKTYAVLYPALFNDQTDACKDGVTKDPFEQLKCQFKKNMEQAGSINEDSETKIRRFGYEGEPKYEIDLNGDGAIGADEQFADPFAGTAYPMAELGLRAIEKATIDKLQVNQTRKEGAIDQAILRPQASWNFVFFSDENDECLRCSWIKGKHYCTTWNAKDEGHWHEAYAWRDYCSSSSKPGERVTPELLFEEIQGVRKGEPFKFHAFGYFDLPGYTTPSNDWRDQESYSIGYWELVDKVGGKLIDIANTDMYSQALSEVGQQVNADTVLLNLFCLSHQPSDVAQLKCEVDSRPVTHYYAVDPSLCPSNGGGWLVRLPDHGTYNSQIRCTYPIVAP